LVVLTLNILFVERLYKNYREIQENSKPMEEGLKGINKHMIIYTSK
jgi:hypothetical protein